MSSDALPISPSRFAEALKSLPLSTLHLKVLELRNSIAHLDYSNEQLRPFALGTSQPIGSSPSEPQQPDQDCIDAIRENEQVISRMEERIRLVRAEVEDRGQKWEEFASKEELEEKVGGEPGEGVNGEATVNGDGNAPNGTGERHPAWTDGTFQTGVIRGGRVEMDAVPGSRTGGTLSDEELRRRMEEQLRGLGDGQDDEEEGMHL
jgi:hypothetical protein